ncbi:MAG: site-specific integrase [Anaerolineae bacterium]|nr:site-specific integrase [Anaerolineae bacterium]
MHSAQMTIETTGSDVRRKNYATAVRQFIAFCETEGLSFDNQQLLHWRQSLIDAGYKPNTINAKLAAIRTLLETAALVAHETDTILTLHTMARVKNVHKRRDLTKRWQTSRGYSIEEVHGILGSINANDAKDARLAAMVALAFGTGLRLSEIATLTVRETVLFEKNGLSVVLVKADKFKKSRSIPLPAWVRLHVQTWLDLAQITPMHEPDTPLMRAFDKSGKVRKVGVTPRALQKDLKSLHIEAHDTRRTFARLCKESGMNNDQIRQLLGHKSIVTTERYLNDLGLFVDDLPK